MRTLELSRLTVCSALLLIAAACAQEGVDEEGSEPSGEQSDLFADNTNLGGEYLATSGASQSGVAIERVVLSDIHLTGTSGGSFPWMEVEWSDGTREGGMFELADAKGDTFVLAMVGSSRSSEGVRPVVRVYSLLRVAKGRQITIAEINETAVNDSDPQTWFEFVDDEGTLAGLTTHPAISQALWERNGKGHIHEQLAQLSRHVEDLVEDGIAGGDTSMLGPQFTLDNGRQD